jgi:hypothetical protein
MKFMQDNEHLIFMDVQVRYEEPLVRLPAEDIRALVKAGVTTAMLFNVNLDTIEPVQGKRDYSYYQDRVKLLLDCGMKVMIQCFTFLPSWIPEEWKVKDRFGATYNMLSPWNIQAMQYLYSVVEDMVFMFESERSMAINSILTDGETLFPNEVCIYDEAARGNFITNFGRYPIDPLGLEEVAFLRNSQIQLMVNLQRMFKDNRYSDVWLALHPALSGYRGNGCEHTEEMLGAIKYQIPCANINHLYCTWRQWTGLYPLMNNWKNAYNERVFGGAEYAAGVVDSTKVAIEQNIRGLLIGPCHPFTGYRRIEPWMLDKIQEACQIWQEK